MNRKTFIALSICAPLLFSACGGAETNPSNTTTTNSAPTSSATARVASTPTQEPQVVSASASEAKLAAGGAGEATVKLDIAKGYHVHANPATDKFYIATELQATPQEGITP